MMRLIASLCIALLAVIGAATAQAFPETGRTLTIIVPFAAGGTTDVSARLLASDLEADLGIRVVVVNRPGATTQIGNAELARARPDGYTLALASLPSLAMTYLDAQRRAPYTRASFTPIAHFISGANVLAVRNDSPYRTVGDLVAAARANPRTVRVGTVGLMSNSHLPGIAVEDATGVRFRFVHFNGAAPLVTALLAGDVDVAINGTQTTAPHVTAGTMRTIGFFGATRTALMPEVPTLIEQGIPISAPSSFAIIGPAGMAPEVVATLTTAIRTAVARESFRQRLTQLTLECDYMDPAELERFWAQFDAQQARLIELARSQQ